MKSLAKILLIGTAFSFLLYVSPWQLWIGEFATLCAVMFWRVCQHEV